MFEVACEISLRRYHTRPNGFPIIRRSGSLAQLVEQLAFNQLVARSNRARPTIIPVTFNDLMKSYSIGLNLSS